MVEIDISVVGKERDGGRGLKAQGALQFVVKGLKGRAPAGMIGGEFGDEDESFDDGGG